MSIRPIDMMMMPNKSQETSIFQHQEQQKLEHEQHFQGNSFQDHIKHNGEKTIQPEKSENQEYRYQKKKEDGGGNGGAFNKGQQKKKNEKKEDEKKEQISLSKFDVRI